jgi:hypothetical protein
MSSAFVWLAFLPISYGFIGTPVGLSIRSERGAALLPAGGRGNCASESVPRLPSLGSAGLSMQLQQADSTTVPKTWVDLAAAQQGRDPARLAPLKPLPDVIVIRNLEVFRCLVCTQKRDSEETREKREKTRASKIVKWIASFAYA